MESNSFKSCCWTAAVQLCSFPTTARCSDRFCTSIWAIENSGLRVYPGGYSDYLAQRNRERAFEQFEYEQYRAEKSRLQQEVYSRREQTRAMRKAPKRMGNSEARLHKGKSRRAAGQLAKRAAFWPNALNGWRKSNARPTCHRCACAWLGQSRHGAARRVHRGTDRPLRHAYGAAKRIVRAFDRTRTVMLGANGAGKTTLLEHLMRGGAHARFAGGVKAGYFSQNHDVLDPDKTVLGECAQRLAARGA